MTELDDYTNDKRIWDTAYAFADALAIAYSEVSPANDPVGHKTMVRLDRYLVVQFVASEDFEERDGLVGWTLWDMEHDISFDDWSYGTSAPESVVKDVQAAMASHHLGTYARDYDRGNPAEPRARVTVYDQSTDPYASGNGWVVNIADYEALRLFDTSSRWFAREEDARAFAEEVAALLIIEVES